MRMIITVFTLCQHRYQPSSTIPLMNSSLLNSHCCCALNFHAIMRTVLHQKNCQLRWHLSTILMWPAGWVQLKVLQELNNSLHSYFFRFTVVLVSVKIIICLSEYFIPHSLQNISTCCIQTPAFSCPPHCGAHGSTTRCWGLKDIFYNNYSCAFTSGFAK